MTKLLLLISLFLSGYGMAQDSSTVSQIIGKVTEEETGEFIPFSRIIAKTQSDSIIGYAITDLEGKYKLSLAYHGIITLEVNQLGFEPLQVTNISIITGQTHVVDITLPAPSELLDCVLVTSERPILSNSTPAKIIISKDVSYSSPTRSKTRRDWGRSATANTATNTESYAKIRSNKFKKVKTDPLSTFSIDVDKAAYSNIRRFISDGNLPPQDAVRIEEMINYFHYEYDEPTDDNPFSIQTEYTECAWNKKHRLLQIGIKGKSLEMDEVPPNNLVFLIDVSGSMQSYNKLELLKKGFGLLIDQMRPKDQIAMVVYAGAAGVVLEPTAGDQKETIKTALMQLEAGGSTAGAKGIELAYQVAKENYMPEGNNRVILATDGDFNVGVSSEDGLEKLIVRKREDGVFLSVLGFGQGNLQDSKMERLADKGNGNYAYIDNIFEAKKVLVTELGGTLVALAKDVKIQVEFNPKNVKNYRLIGYENRVLENEDFNDDKKDAGELGAGHTVTALYEIIPAGSNEEIVDIDPLKYQISSTSEKHAEEIVTVKFRYKNPKGNKSKLITHTVDNRMVLLAAASENVKFSSAVAQFGLLLRDSDFKGDSNYDNIVALAESGKGTDNEGYRSEFIKLVKMAHDLSQ